MTVKQLPLRFSIPALAILLMIGSFDLMAAGVHKCKVNGKIIYSNKPCYVQNGQRLGIDGRGFSSLNMSEGRVHRDRLLATKAKERAEKRERDLHTGSTNDRLAIQNQFRERKEARHKQKQKDRQISRINTEILSGEISASKGRSLINEVITGRPGKKDRRTHGAINPKTGQYFPKSGNGVINPNTGQYFPKSGSGYINTQTGEYIPGS